MTFDALHVSDDLNSLYDPWSREFGQYVIVFQDFDSYVWYRFLVTMLSFSKESSLLQNPTALPLNFDHTSCISGRVVNKTAAGKESGQQTARCAAHQVFG